MPTTTRGTKQLEEPQSSGSKAPSLASLFCCCSVSDVVQEVQLTAAALNKPPPIELSPGHANAENEVRGMAAPKWGCLEIVNKNKDGEIIAVLVSQNATELVLERRETLHALWAALEDIWALIPLPYSKDCAAQTL